MFDGHAPGDTVRCPVDGCAFAGTVGQVMAHVSRTDDAGHDRAERRVESAAGDGTDDATGVDRVVRTLAEEHDATDDYESEDGGFSLFPFD